MTTPPTAQTRTKEPTATGVTASGPHADPSRGLRSRSAHKQRISSTIRSLVVSIFLCGICVVLFAYRTQVYAFIAQLTEGKSPAPITAVAREMVVPHIVLAGGELHSAEAVDVTCEVEGTQLKIVEMVPEGTEVKAGQVVVRIDPSEIKDRLAQQRIKVTQANAAAKAAAEELKIQRNLGDSAIADAQLTVTLAELDRKKYLEGEYQVEINDLRGSIALAETDLQEAKDMVEHFEMLMRKGFRSREQLEAKQQAVERAKYNLSRDQEKMQVLERFTRERQEVELTAKAKETIRELARVRSSHQAATSKAETDLEVADATAQLEREQLNRIERQLELCDVRAPAAGTLIYAKDQNKKVELGAPVHFKQKLFSLPDLSEMQVYAYVHESEIQQVKTGMRVDLKVDAFPDLPMSGKVLETETYYDATRHWISGGVKEYGTEIVIESYPVGINLKPGMTAQVEIHVGDLSDGVIVPVVAVTHRDGKSYCYRQANDDFQWVSVELGNNTEEYVEVLSGLQPGDRVALDARARASGQQDAASDSGASESLP